ncbi:hypothetical protein V8687_04015 [Shewanella baltica]|uniref:hypothetical protein n=1 Tax=Shewanella baltica TaxID=62322 RepID=UPI0030CD1A25
MKKKYNPSTTSKTDLVVFRCPIALKEKMVEAVKSDEYQSITDLVVEAVKDKLRLKSEPDS